jgi:Protein of unknown function (DUF1565)
MTRKPLTTSARRGALLCAGIALLPLLNACFASTPHVVASASSTTVTPSTIRYVSPTGRDTWPGSRKKPWRTLGRALPALLPGQTLYVRGGEYRETLVKLHVHVGSPTSRINVLPYPGERPVVRGVLWLQRPSYWTITGLNVTWDASLQPAPLHMVKVTGGVGWVWRDSEIWGSRASTNLLVSGYGAREPRNWLLTDNCIHDVRPPSHVQRSSNLTIGAMKAAGPGRVTRNLVVNAPGPQNVAFGSPRGGGPSRVLFDYNTVYGGSYAVALTGDTNAVTVQRNIFGGVTSGLLIRWNSSQGAKDVVRQNFGMQARRFMRPAAEDAIGGPGNVLHPGFTFSDKTTCKGFSTTAASALPYGRDGVG